MMRNIKLKLPDSGYRSFLLSYPVIVIIACAYFLKLFFLYEGAHHPYDTKSYESAFSLVIQGIPDIFRTPIYPLIIGFMKYVFGNSWDSALTVTQFIVFLISGIYLYKTAKMILGHHPRIIFWMIVLYLANPGIIHFSTMILTETFAVSGMIFLCYTVMRILPRPKSTVDMIWPNLWLLILVALRPAFLYLIPVLGLLYLYMFFSHKWGKRNSAISLVGLIAIIGCVVCYQKAITARYGIHSLSIVTLNNNYCTIRYSGRIDHTLAQNPELREIIKSTYPTRNQYSIPLATSEYDSIAATCGYVALEEYENAIVKTYPKDYAWAIIDRWKGTGSYSPMLPDIPINWYVALLNSFVPNMALYTVLLIIYSVFMVKLIKRSGRIPVKELFLYLVCCGLLLTTILGAQSEYTRLNLPALPAFFLIMADLISRIRIKWFVRN